LRQWKKCPYKTGDLLKEVQLILNFLWQDKKQELTVAAMFVNGSGRNEQSL
jgi:hypothetical protein